MALKEEGMDTLWSLVKIALAVGLCLGLLRLHERLRALERKVEELGDGVDEQENEDE